MARQTKTKAKPKTSTGSASKSRLIKVSYPNFRSKFHVPSSGERMAKLSHRDALNELVTSICESEAQTLSQWLADNPSLKKELEKRQVVSSLTKLLAELPSQVSAETPSDIQFQPEVPSTERVQLHSLTEQLSKLQKLKEEIASLSALKPPAELDVPDVKSSEDVIDRLKEYNGHLEHMDSCCNAVLALAAEVNKQLFSAREVQDKLFDKCNQKRFKSSDSSKGSKDPKDLIRALPKYLK